MRHGHFDEGDGGFGVSFVVDAPAPTKWLTASLRRWREPRTCRRHHPAAWRVPRPWMKMMTREPESSLLRFGGGPTVS